jgi:hypothetical protein
MTWETLVLVWDKYTNMAGLARLTGSQLSPLDICISNGNAYHTFNTTNYTDAIIIMD